MASRGDGPHSLTTGERMVDEFKRQQSHSDSVINDEDQVWLQQVAANVELPPALPPRRSIISDDGEEIDESEEDVLALVGPVEEPPLPPDPGHLSVEDATKPRSSSRERSKERKRKYHYWQYIPAIYIGTKAYEQFPVIKETWNARKSSRERKASDGRPTSADGQDPTSVEAADPKEAAEEKKDVNKILQSLNLSAMNDKVIGLSKESQKLLESFTQVLKDIVNGVPTAYDDLEKLLSQRNEQLEKMFNGLPPFLQTLVKSIPEKVFSAISPEVAAAAAATGMTGKKEGAGKTTEDDKKKKKKSKADYIPSLKSLIAERAVVATMLKSILNFLRLRFPAILAPNILLSLAVTLLLFVFWYCYKRGKEERLKKGGPSRESSSEIVPKESH